MKSTEGLSIRDMAEIADAAHELGLDDASVILIDALYDRFDGKHVEDLSDVVEEVRKAAFTYPATVPLRHRQKKLLNIIFSVMLPLGALLYDPRYVVSAATAGVALIGAAKLSIAQASPFLALRSLPLPNFVRGRHGDQGRRTRHVFNRDVMDRYHAVPMASNLVQSESAAVEGTYYVNSYDDPIGSRRSSNR